MSTYTLPRDVQSPFEAWDELEILDDGGDRPDTIAYAIGIYNGELSLGIRWTGSNGRPAGYPNTRGKPTWMCLDEELSHLIVGHRGWLDRWNRKLNAP